MTPGPGDGAGLYPDDHDPCLRCGALVGVDWDGVLCWHFTHLRKPWEPPVWCPGSRTALEVPT